MARAVVSLIGIVVLLSGCGRTPGVTNAGLARPQRAWMAASVGDRIEYQEDNDITLDFKLGNISSKGTGHRSAAISEARNRGRSLPAWLVRTYEIRVEQVAKLENRSKSRTIRTWVGEDDVGNLYLLGEALDGAKWDVVTDNNPPMCMPAEVKLGLAWSYVAHFASGDTHSCERRCVGTETVKTPAGDLQAFKVYCNFTKSGVSMSGYEWYSPRIPIAFEAGADFYVAQQVRGIATRTTIRASIESIHLAQ